MDYDGYERRPPQAAPPLSRENEERIAAERRHDDEQRRKLEQDFLAFLQNSPAFLALVATHDFYNEYTRDAIAAAAARSAAEKFSSQNIDAKQLAELVRDTVEKFSRQPDQANAHQQPTAPRPEQRIEPDRLGRPSGQWLGKYAELLQPATRNDQSEAGRATADIQQSSLTQPTPSPPFQSKYAELEALSNPRTHDDPSEEIARRQREDSDRQQSVPGGARSDERKPTEQSDREARTEQTDRHRECSASTKEMTDDRAQRREAIARKYGHELDGLDRDGPEDGRDRER